MLSYLKNLVKQFKFVKRNSSQNSRQSFIVFQAVLAGCFILPFLIFRLISEQWMHALVDFIIIFILITMGLIALSGRYVNQIAGILVVTYILAAWAVVGLFGLITLYWAVVIGMATHFILRQREALLADLILLIGILWIARGVDFEILFTFTSIYILSIILASQFSGRMTADNRNLRALATQDVLTSSGNRLALDDAIMHLYERPMPQDYSLLILDIDHFKKINDTHGHAVGDQALQNLVKTLREICPNNTHIYRYGGEEFCILIPKPPTDAVAIAEQIRLTVEQSQLIDEQPVTISIGLAALNDSENARDWFIKADSALYLAKKQGRNQVCVHFTARA